MCDRSPEGMVVWSIGLFAFLYSKVGVKSSKKLIQIFFVVLLPPFPDGVPETEGAMYPQRVKVDPDRIKLPVASKMAENHRAKSQLLNPLPSLRPVQYYRAVLDTGQYLLLNILLPMWAV